jgi:hypothetical protein
MTVAVKSEMPPLTTAKRANVHLERVVLRSAHVHRECHAKLWTTAQAIATAVATRYCTPPA